MLTSFKTFTATFLQSAQHLFVEGFGWSYEYPETPRPYGESAAREWEPFNKFCADYKLIIPTTPLIYDINFNPIIQTYSGIGKIYFTLQDIIVYQENLIYEKKAINGYSYFGVSPNTNPSPQLAFQPNTVSGIIVELFKPGIQLTVNFHKPFYYENPPATP